MATFLNNTTAKRDIPVAVKGISNKCSIGIYDIEYGINDRVKYAYVFTENCHSKFRKAMVYSTAKGRLYFLSHGRREFLDEYIKTEMFGNLYTR